MLPRERVIAALERQPERLDHVPISDAFFTDTLERWRAEGLPSDLSPGDYFGFDLDVLFADLSLRLPERAIEDTDDYLVAEDKHGFTAKRYKHKAGIHYIDNRVKTHEDWDGLKERLRVDLGDTARVGPVSYFEPFVRYPTWSECRNVSQHLEARHKFVVLNAYGPWEHSWRMCGYTGALMALASDPDWAADMFAAHTDLLIAVVRRAVEEGVAIDALFLVDDLGVQSGPLFSPRLMETLLAPEYRRLADFLEPLGIYFFMHSCGAIGPLIPMLARAGVQLLQPLQATAGLDVCELKSEFGDRLAFMGNINARIMSDPAAIEDEIRRKLPAAARGGGYIFSSDHSVPSDVSLRDYERILQLARELTAA